MKQHVITYLLIALLAASQAFMWVKWNEQTKYLATQAKADPYATTDDYLLIGNSILGNHDWGKAFNKTNIYNSSIPGLSIFEANQFPSTFVNRKSKKIFVELGINDLNTKVPTKMVVYAGAAFLGLVKKVSPKSEVYVISVLPIRESKQKGKATNAEITQYNTKIAAWAKNNHIQYIDAYSAMLDGTNQLNADYTSDGLHLTATGYDQLANVLKAYL